MCVCVCMARTFYVSGWTRAFFDFENDKTTRHNHDEKIFCSMFSSFCLSSSRLVLSRLLSFLRLISLLAWLSQRAFAGSWIRNIVQDTHSLPRIGVDTSFSSLFQRLFGASFFAWARVWNLCGENWKMGSGLM